MIKAIILGVPRLVEKYEKKDRDMVKYLGDAIEYLAVQVKNRARQAYLRGPRPSRLGAISSDLIKSIRAWKDYDMAKGLIIGKAGTSVRYGIMWEKGISRVKKGPRKRPFMAPALEDLRPEIIDKLREVLRRSI